MSTSPISPEVMSLLKKISQLTAEEASEVEHFIEFLVTKKGSTLHYADMMPDIEDSSTDTISEFIASFTASPISPPHTSPHYSSDLCEKDKFDRDNRVIIAPEEPVEKQCDGIDFADINARFAKKREEKRGEKSKLEELDWL